MTGAYLRVKREGKWTNVEVEHLTDIERVELFKNRPTEELLRWLNLTCKYIANIEDKWLAFCEADDIAQYEEAKEEEDK